MMLPPEIHGITGLQKFLVAGFLIVTWAFVIGLAINAEIRTRRRKE